MNKIQELRELQSKASELSQEMITKIEDLVVQTGKYVFSVRFANGYYDIIINQKNSGGEQPIAIEMDSENAQKLHLFLSNIFDDEKIVKKVELKLTKQ